MNLPSPKIVKWWWEKRHFPILKGKFTWIYKNLSTNWIRNQAELLVLSFIFKNSLSMCFTGNCKGKILNRLLYEKNTEQIIPWERLFQATANGSCFKYWVILFSLGLGVFCWWHNSNCLLSGLFNQIDSSLQLKAWFFSMFVVIICQVMHWVLYYLSL